MKPVCGTFSKSRARLLPNEDLINLLWISVDTDMVWGMVCKGLPKLV